MVWHTKPVSELFFNLLFWGTSWQYNRYYNVSFEGKSRMEPYLLRTSSLCLFIDHFSRGLIDSCEFCTFRFFPIVLATL